MKASHQGPGEDMGQWEEKLHHLIAKVDRATEEGPRHSGVTSVLVKAARTEYYHDFNFLFSMLIHLGGELKSKNGKILFYLYFILTLFFLVLLVGVDRLDYLKNAIRQCNTVMLQRVLSRGEVPIAVGAGSEMPIDGEKLGLTAPRYLSLFADYGIHFPMQLSSLEPILKILRFVDDQALLLPSKERFPFLVLAEVLEMPYNGSDERVYWPTGYNFARKLDSNKDKLLEMRHDQDEGGNSLQQQDLAAMKNQVSDSEGHRESVITEPSSCDKEKQVKMPIRPSIIKKRNSSIESNHVGEHCDSHHSLDSAVGFNPFVSWQSRKAIIRCKSPYGSDSRWDLKAFIVKTDTSMKREVVALQFVRLLADIFDREGVDVVIKPYKIICTGLNSGLIEYLPGTSSIHSIKKCLLEQNRYQSPLRTSDYVKSTEFENMADIKAKVKKPTLISRRLYGRRGSQKEPHSNQKGVAFTDSENSVPINAPAGGYASSMVTKSSLKEYFEQAFGPSYSPMYAVALDNFVRSLAGYSLVTYILQVVD